MSHDEIKHEPEHGNEQNFDHLPGATEHFEHGHNDHDGHEDNFHEEPPKKNEMAEFAKKGFVIAAIIILIIAGSYGVIRLAPSLFSSLASISVSVSSIFKPKATPIASPFATATPVVIESTPEPTITPTITTSYTNSATPTPTNTYRTNTKADLVLHILSTGVIDRNTNIFVPKTTMNANERAAIRFEVINVGGRSSGTWTFSMLMPITAGKDVYSSPVERSLNSGEKMEFTIGFDNIRGGRQSATVSVDEGGLVSESRKDNNAGTAYFNVVGNTSYVNNYTNGYSGGLPDLAIRAIAVGTLDPRTGAFISTSQIYSNQRVGLQFEVSNVGGSPTGPWTFNADLPSDIDSYYQSGYELSLAPGERIVLTIGFDNVQTNYSDNYNDNYNYDRGRYGAPVTIKLDTNQNIRELNESNNILNTAIPVIN